VQVLGGEPHRGAAQDRLRGAGHDGARAAARDRAAEVVTMGRFGVRGTFGRLRADDRRRVADALDRLDVADLAGRRLDELSGGQRQRVLVAQGLAHGADLAACCCEMREGIASVKDTMKQQEIDSLREKPFRFKNFQASVLLFR